MLLSMNWITSLTEMIRGYLRIREVVFHDFLRSFLVLTYYESFSLPVLTYCESFSLPSASRC